MGVVKSGGGKINDIRDDERERYRRKAGASPLLDTLRRSMPDGADLEHFDAVTSAFYGAADVRALTAGLVEHHFATAEAEGKVPNYKQMTSLLRVLERLSPEEVAETVADRIVSLPESYLAAVAEVPENDSGDAIE